MVLWSVDVIHLTKDLPLAVGNGPLAVTVERSAYVVMPVPL